MSMLEKHEHQNPTHDFDGIVENREQRPPTYFTVLFYGLVLWGTVFMAYFLLSGWSSDAEFRQKMAGHQAQVAQQGGSAPATAAPPQVDAGKLFAEHCAGCHGPAGKGGIGPDLTAAGYRFGRAPADVAASIRNGRPSGMPAFGNQLSGEQIDALTGFVLALK
jgi:cytochrome c oxidase cbb3-type subunit 3